MLSLAWPWGVLNELLCADELVLMSETIKALSNKFLKWKEAFESTGLKVNLGKTKFENQVDPCGVCSLRVRASSVLCVQCGKWILGRCAVVKMVTAKLSINFAC